MRFSFTFAGFAPLFATSLIAPAFAQAPTQAALIPVVSAANDAADANRLLRPTEAAAFFMDKTGGRKIAPGEIVYFVARPVPRSEARTRAGEAASYFYDAKTKELTLYGGFFQRAANRGDDENTLLLDQTRTFGKRRDEKDSFGNPVTVTPETNITYTLNLTNLPDFDARLYRRNTQRIALSFKGVDALDARKISRSLQIVLGVRRTGNLRGTALGGPLSIPRNPQAEAMLTASFTMIAPLTDIFVIDTLTKKVLFHYLPKSQMPLAPTAH